MKNLFKPLKKTLLGSAVAATLLVSSVQADCTYQLFTITSIKGTPIGEFVDQLSDECSFTVIVTDPEAEKLLDKELNKTNLKNLTVDEVLDLVLKENNLFYELENNILHISYLVTRTFDIDYIITTRKSVGSTGVTLSNSTSQGGAGAAGGGAGGQGSGGNSGNNSRSGIQIETIDEVSFWEDLDLEFQAILNRPEDNYSADAPIINKTAGLVTVSATPRQIERLKVYLIELQRKAKAQVLIDVKLLSVQLNNKHETGVDWSQLYALQNFELNANFKQFRNVTEFEAPTSITEASPIGAWDSHILSATGGGSINEVIKFLKTQGNVKAISNPKIMTLNNQPALISVGSEFFYKIQQTENQQGSGGGVANTLQSDSVQSVFAGILLDITPEIDDNGRVTLKINPALSETILPIQPSDGTTSAENAGRTLPPDLNRRQLSAVVTVQDGERVILGGLIQSKDSINENKIPLLGDIPILGWLFKYEEKINTIEELVIVIEPHIIKDGKQTVSLSDLGYSGLNEDQLDSQAFIRSENQEELEELDAKNAELEAEQTERSQDRVEDKADDKAENELEFETE
ncbi:MAG: pilus (MSHA type) biogenesis protein MshL [Arcobacter sp.]|nr:MAG: pilus (MSHA type) biogenesis protein MshL [Arcobacter sp.]